MRAFIAALMLLITSPLHTAEPPTPLEFTCAVLDLDCHDILMPSIVYTDLMGVMGLYGAYYPGDKWIFIDPQAPGHVVVHEVTHYVLYEVGLHVSRCLSEEAARRVHRAWESLPYTEDWRKQYNC